MGRQNVSRKTLDVKHACPYCPIIAPRGGCTTCRGSGLIPESAWVRPVIETAEDKQRRELAN